MKSASSSAPPAPVERPVRADGIGGERAAERRAGVEPRQVHDLARRRCARRQVGHAHAGVDAGDALVGVQLGRAVEAIERQHHALLGVERVAQVQLRATAARDERNAALAPGAQAGRDLFGAPGPDDGRDARARQHRRLAARDVGRADDRLERVAHGQKLTRA